VNSIVLFSSVAGFAVSLVHCLTLSAMDSLVSVVILWRDLVRLAMPSVGGSVVAGLGFRGCKIARGFGDATIGSGSGEAATGLLDDTTIIHCGGSDVGWNIGTL
jgi:hypothetical protein